MTITEIITELPALKKLGYLFLPKLMRGEVRVKDVRTDTGAKQGGIYGNDAD